MAVTDEAIEKIKGMIVSGALRPGDRLPKESELAAELGLSRNSLREAVRALSLIRILDVRQGDGTYVTSLDPQLLLEALSFVVALEVDDEAHRLQQELRIQAGHIRAVALPYVQDADQRQRPHGLAQRVAGQPQLGGELALLGEPVAGAQRARDDHALDFLDRLVGDSHVRPPSRPALR